MVAIFSSMVKFRSYKNLNSDLDWQAETTAAASSAEPYEKGKIYKSSQFNVDIKLNGHLAAKGPVSAKNSIKSPIFSCKSPDKL